jgi:hypothetical protein
MPPIARPMLRGLVLVIGLVVLLGVSPAAANDQTCDNLISLPGPQTVGYTITAPGIYCLDTDVIMAASFTAGNAITIATNYVTLDLKGHKVHGAAAGGATQAAGIFASGRRNVTIKNGTVWGFHSGIILTASSVTTLAGYVVDGVRAELNRGNGIIVQGANVIVRHNVIANTGPTTLPGNHNAEGIRVDGSGARVLNNDVLTVIPAGAGNGIGINLILGNDVLVVGNRITTADFGVAFTVGATGKYRDNLTSGVGTPFSGGTNAGNNN